MVIITGQGGEVAKVTDEGELHSIATTELESHHASENHGRAFIINTGTTANALTTTATAGEILFLQNTSADLILAIHSIIVSVDAEATNTILTIKKNMTVGTVGQNNSLTPVNLNFEQGVVAEATAHSWDETNNGLTNLTVGTLLLTAILGTGMTTFGPKELGDAILLANQDNISIGTVLGTNEFTASIIFYYED